METVKLEKRNPAVYSLKKNEIQAYSGEGDVLGDLAALADSVFSGGVIATDTLSVGPVDTYYTIKSPISVTADSTGVGISFSGSMGVEIGIHIDTPSATNTAEPSPGAGYNSQESLCH